MIFSALVFSSKCTSEEVRHLSTHSQYVAFFPSARHGPNTVCMIGYPVLASMLNFTLTVAAAPSNEVYVSSPAVGLMIVHLSSSPPEFMRNMESMISLSILTASLAYDPPLEAPCWGTGPPEVCFLCPELDADFCCCSVFCGGLSNREVLGVPLQFPVGFVNGAVGVLVEVDHVVLLRLLFHQPAYPLAPILALSAACGAKLMELMFIAGSALCRLPRPECLGGMQL